MTRDSPGREGPRDRVPALAAARRDEYVRHMAELPLVQRARSHADRTAVITTDGSFTYRELLEASGRVASRILAGRSDLEEARVAFLVPPSFDYVAVQWGIWRAGGIAVPLAVSHPVAELRHVIENADASIVIADPELEETVRGAVGPAGRLLVSTRHFRNAPATALPDVAEWRRALMVHTSGTTGKPKGVVTTHTNVRAQVTSLITAWEWNGDDHILLTLPLHHVHGIINVLTCALWAGARCEMLPRFDAEEVWRRFVASPITLFMAVPTIYHRLIVAWEKAAPERRKTMSDACRRMRLMVSGSAPLPVQLLERWREICGHTLLERYGMTEIGMGLSNPLRGERIPGHVGTPVPGIEVRLVDEHGHLVDSGSTGEIQVRGTGVFCEYWREPEETQKAFHDGWFATGDVAVVENGSYRIVGRRSIDIIKTGGHKVSAWEIEETLRSHPDIEECAVVGVTDRDLGESVCVAVELREGCTLTLDILRQWARERLAPYKVPREMCVTVLPRNAMGKVMKQDVTGMFG